MNYSISSDKNKLDIPAIHDYLCNRSYWAEGRSMDSVRTSIDHSMCFGVYDENERMVGFARVVTDKVVFAYLMDVFILEAHRGKGLAKLLLRHIMEHPELQVRLRLLRTANAHELYRQFGFEAIDDGHMYMQLRDPSKS